MTKLRQENSIAQFAFCVGGVAQFANSASQFANSDIDSLGLRLGLG